MVQRKRKKAEEKVKPKKLEEYEQTMPEQLLLFQVLAPADRKFSNTIELYDFIPKYHWGKVERVNGTLLHPMEREFECRGVRYKVMIQPASIKDKDGTYRSYFPGKREELVEDALRKFAVEGKGVFLDDEAGVTFTLYQLQQELKRNGHDYNITQLKDALLICARTNISVSNDSGSSVLVGNLFETLGLQTREDWKGTGTKSKAFVRFNSLVTGSIKARSFRLLNYQKTMAYKSVIARQLHKRMAHHYIQASIAQPYHILLTTMIRDFGLTQYKWLSHNLQKALPALDELKAKDVILDYTVDQSLDHDARNKLVEAKFIIIPHPHFVGEVRHANVRQKRIK